MPPPPCSPPAPTSALFTCLAGVPFRDPATLVLITGALILLIILFALALLLTQFVRRLRRTHPDFEFGIEPPTCPHCRYDLRASPDHCPECGRPVPPLDRTIIQYLIRLRRKS
jgi:hypothetical protein